MRAGKLRYRLRFERNVTTTEDVYGTEQDGWVTFATVRGDVEQLLPGKSESQLPQGIRMDARPAKITIRYLPGLTSDMRVVLLDDGGRVLRIVSGPAEIGHRDGMQLTAEEYSTQGQAQ